MDFKIETFNKAVKKEKLKIIRELKKAEISAHKMKILEPIIANASWMRIKLDEIAEAVATESIVVEYDNGGGQKGIRKNPFFDGYEALFKSYMLAMGRILDSIPDRIEAEAQLNINAVSPETVLDKIRAKKD